MRNDGCAAGGRRPTHRSQSRERPSRLIEAHQQRAGRRGDQHRLDRLVLDVGHGRVGRALRPSRATAASCRAPLRCRARAAASACADTRLISGAGLAAQVVDLVRQRVDRLVGGPLRRASRALSAALAVLSATLVAGLAERSSVRGAGHVHWRFLSSAGSSGGVPTLRRVASPDPARTQWRQCAVGVVRRR